MSPLKKSLRPFWKVFFNKNLTSIHLFVIYVTNRYLFVIYVKVKSFSRANVLVLEMDNLLPGFHFPFKISRS